MIGLLQETIAYVGGEELVLTGAQSALDLLATVKYETDCTDMVVEKAVVDEALFDLRTGLLGEILQKFTNYGVRMAVVGDFSAYSSKSLRDFIRESNRGRHFFFVATREEAVDKLLHNR